MFDQERFDGLARGLATGRLTRWQVIKGFGAGVILGSAGLLQPWSARFAEGQTRAGKSAPVGSISNPRVDPVKANSCKEFNDYIKHTGVTDEEGNNYPGWGGVTSYKCEWKQEKYHWRKFKCQNKNHVCVRTTTSAGAPAKVRVKFKALGPVTVVDWQPSEPQTHPCEYEEKSFVDDVLAHEQQHVNDINQIVKAADDSWRSKPPFTASAPRKAGVQIAVDNLRREIEKAEKDHCDRITKQIKDEGAKFDANHKIPEMDCTQCCSEGETVCNGFCVDLLTDTQNCGKCGYHCYNSAAEDCVGGKCQCKPGYTNPSCGCCPPDQPRCCTTDAGLHFCCK